ncbi:GTP cyclohydrolase I FolE2 [Candidatus Poribacteria bacterium]|nr:GTP cyclohydrolase I FolE2 [Candidatus Poribacteria bacterium]
MNDVQKEEAEHKIDLDKVGVKGVRYPVTVLDKINGSQDTVATISMYVDLPRHFRGTHMSRFIKILNRHRRRMTLHNIDEILTEMKEKLEAKSAHLEMSFPYFIEKTAPISGQKSTMVYDCKFMASQGEKDEITVEVQVPVMSLCPCSKEISDRGAHNQRSIVTVRVKTIEFVWIEDIIEIVESSASSDLYALLKREDEKYITEKAYDTPRFAEDMVREVAFRLEKMPQISWFSVETENYESIHNHSAYAYVSRNIKR